MANAEIVSSRLIRAPTYTARISLLTNGALLQERHIHREAPDVDSDAFGTHWSFAYCGHATARVQVWREGKLVELKPPVGIFLPPYSLVEWHVGVGEVWFTALNHACEEPLHAPFEAEAFPLQLDRFPVAVEDIDWALKKRGAGFPIGRQFEPNSVAKRAKAEIDRTYSDPEVKLSAIAKRLKCAHAVLCRSFKKSFGLTPVQYRNKMRIWESMGKLVKNGESILSIAQEVGFEDLSQYNRLFRRNITVVPSKFR